MDNQQNVNGRECCCSFVVRADKNGALVCSVKEPELKVNWAFSDAQFECRSTRKNDIAA